MFGQLKFESELMGEISGTLVCWFSIFNTLSFCIFGELFASAIEEKKRKQKERRTVELWNLKKIRNRRNCRHNELVWNYTARKFINKCGKL